MKWFDQIKNKFNWEKLAEKAKTIGKGNPIPLVIGAVLFGWVLLNQPEILVSMISGVFPLFRLATAIAAAVVIAKLLKGRFARYIPGKERILEWKKTYPGFFWGAIAFVAFVAISKPELIIQAAMMAISLGVFFIIAERYVKARKAAKEAEKEKKKE